MNFSLNEIETENVQGTFAFGPTFAYWMLGWWKQCFLNWTRSYINAKKFLLITCWIDENNASLLT